MEGTSACGTARHASKFSVSMDGAYILVTDTAAYCSPMLSLGSLDDGQCAKLLSFTWTASEWEQLINNISIGTLTFY